MKPNGLLIEPFDTASDYLGGTSLSLEAKYGGEVLNPSGDWTPFTPSTEDQDTSNGDTYACVSYGTSNAIEMLARARFQQSNNLSDRFLAKTSGTVLGQGNSPKRVADQLRKGWTVNELEWPDVNTKEEFYADPPAHLKTLAVARGAEYEFGYQYIANSPSAIKTALKTSPVCIAVTAWVEENGIYVRGPFTENHWTCIIAVLPNGNYKVFDSFFPFIKEVHPSACQSVAMSYYLNKNVVSDSLFKKFIKAILAYFSESKPESVTEATSPTTVTVTIPQPPEPVKPVGDEKLIAALIAVESGGDDNAIGDKHLAHKAYGCLQIRQPVCDDVNRVYKLKLKAQDMLGNRALSIKVFHEYTTIYGCQTDEEKARVWNGGPSAKRPGTAMWLATNKYWGKVQSKLL